MAGPARFAGVGAVSAMARHAGEPRVDARRRTVVGGTRLRERIRGMALLAEPPTRILGLCDQPAVLHDLLKRQLPGFKVHLLWSRIECHGALCAILRSGICPAHWMPAMARQTRHCGAASLLGLSEVPEARQFLRSLHTGKSAFRHNPRKNRVAISLQEHPMATQALIRRLPRMIVVVVEQELRHWGGMTTARPVRVFLLMAPAACLAHSINLSFGQGHVSPQAHVVLRRHMLPGTADIVAECRKRSAMAGLAAHIGVSGVRPALLRSANLMTSGAGRSRRCELEPGEPTQTCADTKEGDSAQHCPESLHGITLQSPYDGRRCPAPRGTRGP